MNAKPLFLTNVTAAPLTRTQQSMVEGDMMGMSDAMYLLKDALNLPLAIHISKVQSNGLIYNESKAIIFCSLKSESTFLATFFKLGIKISYY